MRRAGVDVRLDITDRGTVGWFDHWRDLPCYLGALRFWHHEIRHRRPTAALVIDAPGISFPFARVARAAGVPVAYFITPQTWLWNPAGAVARLRAHADVVVPTLEAEARLYEREHLPVIYEGHPALDDLVEAYGESPSQRSGALVRRPVEPGAPQPFNISIVPGSRRHAIRRLLPVMLDATEIIGRRVAVGEVLVSVAAPSLRPAVERCLRGRAARARLIEAELREVLQRGDVALASTGGNLLEAVFAGVPAVACYRVDPLTYLGAKHVLRLNRRVAAYALPNLIAGEAILPELIQRDVTAKRVAGAAVRLLTDSSARKAIRDRYGEVRVALGTPGVNVRIAGQLLARLNLER